MRFITDTENILMGRKWFQASSKSLLASLEEACFTLFHLIDGRRGGEEWVVRGIEGRTTAVPLLYGQRAGPVLKSLSTDGTITHIFTQNIIIPLTSCKIKKINIQHFKTSFIMLMWHLPSCFWPALQWRWLIRQHWAFLSWRGGLKDGMTSVENEWGGKWVRHHIGKETKKNLLIVFSSIRNVDLILHHSCLTGNQLGKIKLQ